MEKKRVKASLRKFKRIDIDYAVRYQPIKNHNWYTSRITNLGAGGTCLVSSEYLGMKTIIKIQITLSYSRTTIMVTGEILWSDFIIDKNLYESGIKFIIMNDYEKELISQHIDEFSQYKTGNSSP